MPNATSSGKMPVDTALTSLRPVSSPRRMIEPLPKSFSICFIAAANASFLSIVAPFNLGHEGAGD